jgi:N-ethylmaleimide reductase
MPGLFDPLRLGALTAPNRVFMAPCTRCRADERRAPHALNAEYYRQRATAGLIISEATQISHQAIGYPGTPGIHTPEQIAGWKLVTSAVHAAGGRIFAQLWHCGRVSHNAYQPDNQAPVSSSAVAMPGQGRMPDGSLAPRPTPRALAIDEIHAIIDDYRRAAQNAHAAGFDGVELHGANGYLPDQFLRDSVNRRTDEFGGSIPNRARFHLLATAALVDVLGPGRVGVRLSPSGVFNDVRDSDPKATFGYLVTQLGQRYHGELAYLHIMEAMAGDLTHGPNAAFEPIPASFFRPMFKGPLVTNAGFTLERAQRYLAEGWADAVAWGELFIANPDLPERFRRQSLGQLAPLNTPDQSTYYTPGPKGYTDYPALT